MNALHDLVETKEEWINTLECEQYLKRHAAEDYNKTPSKKPSQGSTGPSASSSPTDVPKLHPNPLQLSSTEEESGASEESDPSSIEAASLSDSIFESDEEKEPEDDGHPEAGNSAAEICTPEPSIFGTQGHPIFGTPDLPLDID